MLQLQERINDNTMRWAVIGYKRECFAEEFITKHPMDFYEDESEISGDYDFYLYNDHGYYTSSLKYVNSEGFGFNSPLSFLGIQPNFAGSEDFRLKHLRMMFGEEDYSFYPFDVSNAISNLANKRLNVEAARFNDDETVGEIIKWFRGVAKRNSDVRNSNAIIVYEGTDAQKSAELANEVCEWFGIEVDSLVLYCDDADSEHIDISFWWYDADAEIRSLRQKWDCYYDSKSAYASGDMELDMDDYCDLVRRTWWYISHVKTDIDISLKTDSSHVEIGRSFLVGFHEYVKTMERLTYYSVLPEKDNSKNYLFTVSAMLADELSRLAGGKKSGTPTYNYWGEFMGLSGHTMDITMAANAQDERVIYDIERKNYNVLLEAAERINTKKKQ